MQQRGAQRGQRRQQQPRVEPGRALRQDEMRLLGMVSERAYQGEMHWLIFLFECTRPVRPDEIAHADFDEGRLEWVRGDEVERLPIPPTDREIMWPLVRRHRGGFFCVDIDCSTRPMTHAVRESRA